MEVVRYTSTGSLIFNRKALSITRTFQQRLFIELHPGFIENRGLTLSQRMNRFAIQYGAMHHSDKYYFCVDNGVYIIPEDMSYKHFISNTWYD